MISSYISLRRWNSSSPSCLSAYCSARSSSLNFTRQNNHEKTVNRHSERTSNPATCGMGFVAANKPNTTTNPILSTAAMNVNVVWRRNHTRFIRLKVAWPRSWKKIYSTTSRGNRSVRFSFNLMVLNTVTFAGTRIMSAGIQYTCSEIPAASISDFLPMYTEGSTDTWSRRNISFLTLYDRTLVRYENPLWN